LAEIVPKIGRNIHILAAEGDYEWLQLLQTADGHITDKLAEIVPKIDRNIHPPGSSRSV
jgi:hypothetical protein